MSVHGSTRTASKKKRERKEVSQAALISILRHFQPGSDVVVTIRVALRALSDTCHSLLPRLLKCTSSNLRLLSRSFSYIQQTGFALPLHVPFTLSPAAVPSPYRGVGSSFSYLLVTPGPREKRQNPLAKACDAAMRIDGRKERRKLLQAALSVSLLFFLPFHRHVSSYIVKDTFNLSSSFASFSPDSSRNDQRKPFSVLINSMVLQG